MTNNQGLSLNSRHPRQILVIILLRYMNIILFKTKFIIKTDLIRRFIVKRRL